MKNLYLIIILMLLTNIGYSQVRLITNGQYLNIDTTYPNRSQAEAEMTTLWTQQCNDNNANADNIDVTINNLSIEEYELVCQAFEFASETNTTYSQVATITEQSECASLLTQAENQCTSLNLILDTFSCNTGDSSLADVSYACIDPNNPDPPIDATGDSAQGIINEIINLKDTNWNIIHNVELEQEQTNQKLESINNTLNTTNNKNQQIINKLDELKLSNKTTIEDMRDAIVEAVDAVPGGGGSGNNNQNNPLENIEQLLTEIKDQDKAILSGGSANCLIPPSCNGGIKACEIAISNWYKQCENQGAKTAYNQQSTELNNMLNTLFPEGIIKPIDKANEEPIDVSNVLDFSGGAGGTLNNQTYTVYNADVEMDFDVWEELFSYLGILIMISVTYRIMKEIVN